MSLKSEMESTTTGPRIETRKRTAAPVDSGPPKHVHAKMGTRTPPYQFSCKACLLEDTLRRTAPEDYSDEDFANTLFLTPEDDFDGGLCKLYIANKYGDLAQVTTELRPERMATWRGGRVVVVTRRALPGKTVGPRSRMEENKHGELVEMTVPISEYLPEVWESAPVVVSDVVAATAATMLSDAIVDLGELHDILCELAAPRYIVHTIQKRPDRPEVWMKMRLV